MKALSVSGLGLLLAVAFNIQMAVGIRCACGACWKSDGSPGVDIKLYCDVGDCGSACPNGYDRLHCAKKERCMYVSMSIFCKVELTKCSNSCQQPNCPLLGPCVCGTKIESDGRTTCIMAPLGGCP